MVESAAIEIVAAYAACNEEATIAESIRSIKAYVDRIVFIDAVFSSNPMPATSSTDHTRVIVERLCASPPARPLTYIASAAKLDQYYARNAYLEQIHEPDWVFVIDGDEVLYGQHESILRTFDAIRAGKLQFPIEIPVFTVAVNIDKMAPEVTPVEFDTAPLISTMGYMHRLFPAHHNLRYTAPAGASTPALTYESGSAHARYMTVPPTDRHVHVPGTDMFLINHHTRQSYLSYLNDYEWETLGVVR